MAEQNNVFDVFISYRRSDGKEIAGALYDYLTEAGLEVFFDKDAIRTGDYFDTQIESAIRKAPNYILIGSGDVFRFRDADEANGQRDWVREEIRLALEAYDADRDGRTISVLVPPGTEVPEINMLPEDVRAIANVQRIETPAGAPAESLFPDVLKCVTKVTRLNMLHAAYRWYRNSVGEGGRFAKLDIRRTIFPNAEKRTADAGFPVEAFPGEHRSGDGPPRPLFELLEDTQQSACRGFCLIGEGGIGKTTALMRIMETAYKSAGEGRLPPIFEEGGQKRQIPVFVELSGAPDTYGRLYENGFSSFIRRSIYRQIRADRTVKQISGAQVRDIDETFRLSPDVAVDPVTDLLSQETPAPEYLLLLDGLNEVSNTVLEETDRSVYAMIVREIGLLLEKCPNVRVVLTSRSDAEALQNDGLTRLYLSGVDEKSIRRYLTDAWIPPEETERVLMDPELTGTLRNPLFLTLYASLREREGVSARGDVLRLFFNEQSDLLTDYTSHARALQVERDVERASGTKQEKRITAKMQNFILDFILPEAAWRMERENRHHIGADAFAGCVRRVLDDFVSDGSPWGAEGRSVFLRYRGGSARDNVRETAKRFRLLGDADEQTYALLDACVLSLGVLQEGRDGYGFLHQHFRDYFAAVRNANVLRLAVALYGHGTPDDAYALLAQAFGDAPPGPDVRRFTGELLGEHRNRPVFAEGCWRYGVPQDGPCDRNLTDRALAICRGRFDVQREGGHILYSLLQILKETRGDLSGLDLSGLDLTQQPLNGTVLSRPGLYARFEGALAAPETLLPQAHMDFITSVCFHPQDGNTVMTASQDGTVLVWDAVSCRVRYALPGRYGFVYSCRYTPDGRNVVIVSDRNITVADALTGALSGPQPVLPDGTSILAHGPDGRAVITGTADHRKTELRDAVSGRVFDITPEGAGPAESAFFSPDGKKAAVTYETNEHVFLWDVSGLSGGGPRLLGTIPRESLFHPGGFSPDGRILLIETFDGVLLYNVENKSPVCTLEGSKGAHKSFRFSPDGRRIAALSYSTMEIPVWDARTGRRCVTIKINDNAPEDACFSPDGSRIAVTDGSYYGCCADLWDTETGRRAGVLAGSSRGVRCACFSPDGGRFLTGMNNGEVYVWDAEKRSVTGTLAGLTELVSACFSPDGTRIVTRQENGPVRVWDARTLGPCGGPAPAALPQTDGGGSLSPDGGTKLEIYSDLGWQDQVFFLKALFGENVRSFSVDDTFMVLAYDASDRSRVRALKGHTDKVYTAVFDPACPDRVLTASFDGAVRFWSAKTGECTEVIRVLPGVLAAGCDLRGVRPGPPMSEEDRRMLRRYGVMTGDD